MITTWTRIMAIALLASMPMAALADDQSPSYTTYNHPIIGVWDATVIIKDCATREVLTTAHALNAFMPGGMLMDANTMPVGMRGQSFGRWAPAWSDQPDTNAAGIIDFDQTA